MKLFKKIYLFILGIVACYIVFQLANTGRFIGVFINYFSKCYQDPDTSFPCYGIYDILTMLFAIGMGTALAVISIYKVVMFYVKNDKSALWKIKHKILKK